MPDADRICPPFMPDVELVEAVAGCIYEARKATDNDKLIAFSVLRRLYDLGIELPVQRIDGLGAGEKMEP